MSPVDELVPLLKNLRLSGVLQSLELRLAQAAQDNLAPAELLLRLLTDGSHERKLLRFMSPALLILDDLGLRQLAPEETVDRHDVIRLRYERGSIVLTSNRALDARRSKEIAP